MRLFQRLGLLAFLMFSSSAFAITTTYYESATAASGACTAYLSRLSSWGPDYKQCVTAPNKYVAQATQYSDGGYFQDKAYFEYKTCGNGSTVDVNTGECIAPAQADGELCKGTTDHVDVTKNSYFDATANKCLPYLEVSKKTECALLGKSSTSRTFNLVAAATVSSSGEVIAPKIVSEPKASGIACGLDVITSTDCKIDAAGKATCKVTAKYNGQVGTTGLTEKEPLCGVGGKSCPDTAQQSTTKEEPCTYTTNADGSQSCSSNKVSETSGQQQCSGSWGSVNGTPQCVSKAPTKNGIKIDTNVVTKPDATTGGSTTTKTDVTTTTSCTDVGKCSDKSTTTTLVISKDANGATTSTTSTCYGTCGSSNSGKGSDTDGEGDGVGDAGLPGVPDFTEGMKDEQDYVPDIQRFYDRISNAPIISAAKAIVPPSGGGACPIYTADTYIGHFDTSDFCGLMDKLYVPIGVFMMFLYAWASVRIFFSA
ncbi:hypothetical protein HMPREF1487_08978 [Pseudomonas sp. HPB0071]|uniref:hypothetical protein n=1 Tax=unclassified Pseudomonas TaxID=196821 RepID=UPI0002CCBF46|nr:MULTISPECIES: hypothetical protein [unclassified Pseudomonas]ENA28022.1 hypothetical protein HMPREF1487_08978 [Pseudomonas sp. HPB0071]